MSRSDPTFVGTIKSVTGAMVAIEIRDDLSSSLIMVRGESHRVGQIGAFVRIPLGYSNLYGIIVQVGAAAAPNQVDTSAPTAHRWISAALFGESISSQFERGVSQFPTVGDEVHVVTIADLELIYGSTHNDTSITIGNVSSASGIPGTLDLSKLLSRHGAIVGSTGTGKSNLVSVLLDAIATQGYPSARILVLDPHGEYGSAVKSNGYIFKLKPTTPDERPLFVPYWALPADEFVSLAMGTIQPAQDVAVRDAIVALRRKAATKLKNPPPAQTITGDSPIPFNARRLWFELDDFERMTLQDRAAGTPMPKLSTGDALQLKSNTYPDPVTGNQAPYVNQQKRGITRALELMRSRLLDARYNFLFNPGPQLTPDFDGATPSDLDTVVAAWVGHDRPITVLDLSGLPSEVMGLVCGTVLRIVYDSLFWAGGLPVSGRKQPLLVVIEEGHRVLPIGTNSPATIVTKQIAKEGRKYGVGLLVVTQRPTEIDPTILSQCGTMIALRMSNGSDRGAVAGVMPDDLGNLVAMLPALRTGEGLVMGEAMPIPTRLRFRLAPSKPVGDDPDLSVTWRSPTRPKTKHYIKAIENWRLQSEEG